MFIDLHCHILPALDDGADSLIESFDIINNACMSGTKIMVATPHYNYSLKSRNDLNREVLTESYKLLVAELENKKNTVKLFLGSELLADDNINRLYKNNELIPINGSRYLLVEFYFDEDIANVHKYTDEILSMGFIPLIAHPERYGFFDESKIDIHKMVNKGCKFQINKDSLLGNNGQYSKNFAFWMLNNDYAQVIGSDCHNASTRNADMSELYVDLLESYSLDKLNILLHDNPKRILLDMNI